MGEKKTGAVVNVPNVGKGTVVSHARVVKGVKSQEVRTGPNTTIEVPVSDLK